MPLMTFADIFAQEMRLKAVRERRDIDQLTVAKDLGVSPATVSRWKSGVIPDDDTMHQIATYFGVTPGWLRYGQPPRDAEPVTEAPDTRSEARRSSKKHGKSAMRWAAGGRK